MKLSKVLQYICLLTVNNFDSYKLFRWVLRVLCYNSTGIQTFGQKNLDAAHGTSQKGMNPTLKHKISFIVMDGSGFINLIAWGDGCDELAAKLQVCSVFTLAISLLYFV